jgi:hypothetical protein
MVHIIHFFMQQRKTMESKYSIPDAQGASRLHREAVEADTQDLIDRLLVTLCRHKHICLNRCHNHKESWYMTTCPIHDGCIQCECGHDESACNPRCAQNPFYCECVCDPEVMPDCAYTASVLETATVFKIHGYEIYIRRETSLNIPVHITISLPHEEDPSPEKTKTKSE